jgi:hypothetical protein
VEKTYRYASGLRVFALFILVTMGFFWFVGFMALITEGSSSAALFLIFSLVAWPAFAWSFFLLYVSFGAITLSATAVTIQYPGFRTTARLTDIQEIRENQFFLTLITPHGRILIDKQFTHYKLFVANLRSTAPTLYQAETEFITKPLPRTLHAKPHDFANSIGLALFFAALGLFFLYILLREQTLTTTVVLGLISLVFLLSSTLLIIQALQSQIITITCYPDHIHQQMLFKQQTIPLNTVQDIHLERRRTHYKGREIINDFIIITRHDASPLTLPQSQMQRPLLQILDLLTHHYGYKRTYQKTAEPIPHTLFANGSHHPFSWYLQRPSTIPVQNLTDIANWLIGCRYAYDMDQFGRADYWLHPSEFEERRQGDCEDHALWAWRKLIELGYPTEFVVGEAKWSAEKPPEPHAWVTYQADGVTWLLEATSKQNPIRLYSDVQDQYHPLYSVDHTQQTYRHTRYIEPQRP